jgi:hypothetical protein
MIKNLELKVINGEKVSAACTGQLGQAACATCIAAPDCPILRLKKVQAEQIPAPNRKSYLDDLISDNTIIAAGYKKKLQPKVLPIISENHEKKPKPTISLPFLYSNGLNPALVPITITSSYRPIAPSRTPYILAIFDSNRERSAAWHPPKCSKSDSARTPLRCQPAVAQLAD